jgi:hypothetical protein
LENNWGVIKGGAVAFALIEGRTKLPPPVTLAPPGKVLATGLKRDIMAALSIPGKQESNETHPAGFAGHP